MLDLNSNSNVLLLKIPNRREHIGSHSILLGHLLYLTYKRHPLSAISNENHHLSLTREEEEEATACPTNFQFLITWFKVWQTKHIHAPFLHFSLILYFNESHPSSLTHNQSNDNLLVFGI